MQDGSTDATERALSSISCLYAWDTEGRMGALTVHHADAGLGARSWPAPSCSRSAARRKGVTSHLDVFGVLVLSSPRPVRAVSARVVIGATPPAAISDWRYSRWLSIAG